MNLPKKYRVLEVIAASCDTDGTPQRPVYQVIKEAFPSMSMEKTRSIVAKLQEENLLGAPRETPDGEIYMGISRTTYAVIEEEWEKVERHKEELRERFYFALFGFVLGLASSIILPILNKARDLLFGL